MVKPAHGKGHDHGAHGHEHDHAHDHAPGHDHAGHHHDARPPAKAAHDHAAHAHAGHAHHHHDHRGSSESRLRVALFITGAFTLVEGIGGLISGSLALVADAVHMATDAASLVLALVALRIARTPADARFSYGRGRYEVLAAFVNGLALLGLSAWIIVEAVQRLLQPEPIDAPAMLWIAALGFIANLVTFLVLREGDGHAHNLNMRGAVLHVLSDLLGSAAAILAALAIMATGMQALDPSLSAVVAVLILRGGWRVTRESAHILLEGAPRDVDADELSRDLAAAVPGVTGIHHLHAWSLTDSHSLMTLHAVLTDTADREAALAGIQARLKARFGNDLHATVQLERDACAHENCEPPRAAPKAHAHHH